MTPLFREAGPADVAAVVALLRDDPLGAVREDEALAVYERAFADMMDERGNRLIVGEVDSRIVASYQITLISGLSLRASRRAHVESVRVASDMRGRGIGAHLMADAEARARDGGATLMQFTSNAKRDRAHGFYRRLGYGETHIGFKKPL